MRCTAAFFLPIFTACTSTYSVSGGELARMAPRPPDDRRIVLDREGGDVRLDPNSQIRLKLKDGRKTGWMAIRGFSLTDEGLYRPTRTPVSHTVQAVVTDLGPDARRRIEEIYAGNVVAEPSRLVITAPGPHLARGISGFFAEYPGAGTWQMLTDLGVFTAPLSGEVVEGALDAGLEVPLGVQFEDIESAEVKNLSGAKTLALVVGTAAVVALIVTALRGHESSRSRASKPTARPAAPIGPARAAGPAYVGPRYPFSVGVRSVFLVGHLPADYNHRVYRRRQDLGLAVFDAPAAKSTLPFFEAGAERRASVRFIPAFESSYTNINGSGFLQTGSVSLRFRDFWEVGGGIVYFSPTDSQDNLRSSFGGFGRLGLFLPLDVHHRFAVPIRVDAGGGTEERFFTRFGFGLQIRLIDSLALGIYPLNPRLSSQRGDGGEPYDRWSFPSGIELSYGF